MEDDSEDLIYDLRKRISLLEWDLQRMENPDLRKSKEAELMLLKQDLSSITGRRCA
jgi:hypothetical protein